jgi:hypothetical protein
MLGAGRAEGERLTRAVAEGSSVLADNAWRNPGGMAAGGSASMENAARRVDDSDGKGRREV